MLGKGVRGERKPKLETPERVPFAGFRPVEHAVTSPFLDVPIPAYDDAQPLTNEVLAPTSADGLHTPSGISSWAAQPNWSVAQTDLLTRAALQSPLVSEARRVDPHEGSSGASSTMQTASSLGSSLLITASIGFILQIFASNLLGPEETGRVGTAEGIAAICLGLLSLGFDTYVRREVSIRPSHAKEFVPGAILLRAVLSVPVAIFIALLLPVFGKPAKVVAIFVVFALAKFVMQTNEMLAACLHAVGRVKGIAKQNLIAKLFGGVTLLGLIAADRGGISLPISLLVGETVKLVYLAKRTGVELGVWSRIGNQEIRPVLKRSVPFISTVLITSFTMFLDVTLLGFLVSAKEVGFYRFGQQLVMIAYVVGTVLPWVVLPLASRAAAQSRAAFEGVARKAIEAALILGSPLALIVFLHADTIVDLVPGSKYGPTTGSLRIISIMIPLTYLASLVTTLLQAEGRLWIIVRVGIGVAVIDGILVLATARWGLSHFGEGGAGIVAAWAMLIAEGLGTLVLLRNLGWHLWNREVLMSLARTAGCLLPAVLLEFVLRRAGAPGLVRMVIEGIVILANGFLLQVVDAALIKSLLPDRKTTP